MTKTFKGKTEAQHREDMEHMKRDHREWRKNLQLEKTGFFPVFSNQIKPYLQGEDGNPSGNAMRLFIYLGIHSNNETGEVIGVNLRMMEQFFQCKLRTLQYWLEELEEAHLIKRVQAKFKGTSTIFLLPYSTNSYMEMKNKREKTTDTVADESALDISSVQ